MRLTQHHSGARRAIESRKAVQENGNMDPIGRVVPSRMTDVKDSW